MKAIQIILGAGVVVALIGLNVALADVISQRDPIRFDRDAGEGIEMRPISFDFMGGVGEEETQHGGCMMTPGGQEPAGALPLPPPVIIPTAVHGYGEVQSTLAPLNSFNTPPGIPREGRPRNPRTPDDPPRTPPDEPFVIPEPATLVIVGLGLVGVAAMRRRQVKPVAVE